MNQEHLHSHRSPVLVPYKNERPQAYLITLRSQNRISGTVNSADFQMNLPIATDKDCSYMMRVKSFATTALMGGTLLAAECDQYFSNVFDTQNGLRPCGALFVSQGNYTATPGDTGAVLNVPSWKNGRITIRFCNAATGLLSDAITDVSSWVMQLEIYPDPFFSQYSRKSP